MKRFKRILFVNDFNKLRTPALDRAIQLAKENKALLTIIEVLEEFPPQVKNFVNSTSLMEYQRTVEEQSIEGLKILIKSLRKEDVRVAGEVFWGTPFIEIVREVIRNNHDLVMVSPRKEGKIKSIFLGNRIMNLMRKCPCPVWAIKPSKPMQHKKIMAAVDPAPINELRGSLNVKIMELATSLARFEKSELHIISCRKPFYRYPMHPVSDYNQEIKGEMEDELRNAYRKWLDDLLEKFDLIDALIEKSHAGNLNCRTHVLDGEPDDVIPETANRENVDLVVMGTISRTGIPGMFIGNTAEKILQKLDCSVLAVKPDGFKTPVRL